MFAVIHLPQFALQAALRHEPELWARPIALVDPTLTTPRVCDATSAARAFGVTEGLTPTQALARCREVIVRHRAPTQEAAATEAVLQCAYGFSPNIESTSAGTVTLDLRGLSELREGGEHHQSRVSSAAPPSNATIEAPMAPAPEGSALSEKLFLWAKRLRSALASLNLQARIGIGPTPNVARHAAWWNLPATVERSGAAASASSEIQIVLDSTSFIGSLPVAALEPSSDVAGILQAWGIRRIRELLALGQDAVVERLGLEALALFAAASATAMRPLHLVSPAEHFEESFEFEYAVETMEPLLFLLRRFVDYLGQRLELAGLAVEVLRLKLRLESGEVLERRLRVPQPTRRTDILFRMLQTHLETLRTESPITGIALKAEPTQPELKQFNLFEAALRDPHQFQETLARLSALLGADRAGTPVRENSHRADAFKVVPPDFENAPDPVAEPVAEILRMMPLRRLRPARKAQVEFAEESKHSSDATQSDATQSGVAHSSLSAGEEASLLRARAAGFATGMPLDRPAGTQALPPSNVVYLLGPLFNQPTAGTPPSTLQPFNPSTSPTPPISVDELRKSPRPIALRSGVANGRLAIAVGPWRSSGHWWEAGAWQREEWDVQTSRGIAVRLVNEQDEWKVEAVVD